MANVHTGIYLEGGGGGHRNFPHLRLISPPEEPAIDNRVLIPVHSTSITSSCISCNIIYVDTNTNEADAQGT